MLSPADWEERKSQVGASDVPKLFNFDNKGAKDLWKEKIGLIDKPMFENRYTQAGNIIEEPCLMYAFDKLGIENYSMDDRIEHPDIPGFVVSLDGLDVDNNIPVENKGIKHTTYTHNASRFNDRGLEDTTYYRQLMSQVGALNAPGGWLIYNVLQEEDYEHPIMYEPNEIVQERRWHERNDKLIKEIESRVKYFLKCMREETEPSEEKYKNGQPSI